MKKEAAHPAKQGAINGCKGTTSECPLVLDENNDIKCSPMSTNTPTLL